MSQLILDLVGRMVANTDVWGALVRLGDEDIGGKDDGWGAFLLAHNR